MRQALFKVTLTKEAETAVMVDFATVDGTAKSPEDYTPQTGTLTFLPGQIAKNIIIMVREELAGSMKEAFTVRLSNPRGCQLGKTAGEFTFKKGPEVNVNGPLIKNGLLTNAYHREVGRGGYFHEYSGTSEGQSIAIEGAFLAYAVLKDGSDVEKAAAAWFKQTGQKLLDAMGDGSGTGPMLRQPIPSDVNRLTLLHWLFAARGDIPAQGINYTFQATASGGKLTIPQYVDGDARGGEYVYRVWQVYPDDSALLYTSPYSPAYNIDKPDADTSIKIDTQPVTDAGSEFWSRQGKTVVITLPADAPSSVTRWNIVYGYSDAGTIKQGEAQEAYPNWTKIEDFYAACAPDTFRWFEYAMSIAMLYDDRDGMVSRWTMLRNALRRTAVRGQNINDLREIFKPMPNFPAIPAKGEPSGMFCFSNNPDAGQPPADIIDAGGNPDWRGWKYITREGGEGRDNPTAADLTTWTPDKAFDVVTVDGADTAINEAYQHPEVTQNPLYDSAPYRQFVNGAWRISAPPIGPNAYSTYEVQLGRGINDMWRGQTDYQDPDQFMLVVTAGDLDTGWQGRYSEPDQYAFSPISISYFISLTKNFDESQRYVAHSTITHEFSRYPVKYWSELPELGLSSWVDYGTTQGLHRHVTVYPYRVNSMRTDKGKYAEIDPRFVMNQVSNGGNIQDNQYAKTNFTGGRVIMYELIPIEAFQRMDKPYVYPATADHTDDQGQPYVTFSSQPAPDAANVLPLNKNIENFGVSYQPMSRPKQASTPSFRRLDVVYMRLLSGPSKQWVMDNLETAIHGSKMPFFPGAMPFAINADTRNQAFVGFNGNPFHGYQLPDYWYFLQDDANAIHPGLNPATDLPTATLAGVIEYPISATTSAGTAKPAHAMLAEQQLLFLKRAQQKWAADGGPTGVFAHTFVLNTPARATIGNPQPHTWVYTNDDPNTRWVGYQARVAESISRLAFLARSDAGWTTAVAMSVDMAMQWMTMLNAQWPDLNGKPYTDPATGKTTTVFGMPTDFDDPRTAGIGTKYEEPHAAALVLRATIWLKLCGKLTAAQLTTVNALADRCWQYMETRYRTAEDDTMRYTWAVINDTTREQYYGFWHFEIISTICYLLQNPTTLPTGVTADLLRQRLVETQTWTKLKTE